MAKEQQNQSKAKKVYNIVSTAIVAVLFVLLVLVVGVMLAQRNSGKDVKMFGYYTFNVLTDSMKDTINPGDVIVGKQVDANTLVEGDIVTFVAPSGVLKGKNITHRIVEVVRKADGSVDYFRTKGDNPNTQIDDWHLSPENVKAKYVKTSKFLTGFRQLLSKWYGYVILIAIPLAVVFVLIIVGFVKDKTALEKEKQNAVDGEQEKQTSSSLLDNLSDEQKKKLLEEYMSKNKENKD